MKVVAAVVVGGAAVTGGVGTIRGTVLGVLLLGAIGPALTFMGVTAYWERALQGAIILAAVGLDAWRTHRASQGAAAVAAAAVRSHMSGRVRRWFPNGEWAPLAALAVAILVFARHCASFPHRRELLRGDAVQRRDRADRDWDYAGADHRRHRPVGRLDPGADGRDLWHRARRLAPLDAQRRGARSPGGRCRRLAQRGVDRAAVDSAVDRHPGHALAVQGDRRGTDAGGRQLFRISARFSRAGPGLPGGRHSDATADSRRGGCRLRGAGASLRDRPHLVRDWIQRRRRALCRRTGGATARARLRALGRDGKPRRDHLRGACRPGTRRRGQRLRARRRDRGGPGRDLGVRRTGDDRRYANRALRAGSAEERPRAGGTSSGTHGGADRCAAGRHHCARSDAPRRTGRFHVGRRRD